MKMINTNSAKKKLKEGKKLSGAWAQAGSNITAEILADSGFDVVMVDMEHGPGDIPTLISQLQGMQGSDAVPFCRAPWNDFVQIKRILDAGVYGLLVPYINTKEEAIQAVAATKYPTEGIRGVAGSPRAPHYGNNAGDYMKKANDEIFVMVAIETPEAVAHLDDILSVEGLDGIFIGPMDLATSMGHFINPGAPEVQAAIKTVEDKVFKSDKILATVAGSWEDAQKKYEKGYSLLMLMSDTVTLGQTARKTVENFKKIYGE
ncbi:2-dehydro-3-deoxyglucarate aldolase [Eubacterium aggregans]|uniref:2-dehydro-3-deoxyglucarate aldolase n=3 Tax=Eubacterium aggregans TaxID=81409 RepID=A0A1H4AQY2_9FIRM|nr:aldolase/citrate lyase family protein [Eubacterium aggregans]SEA38241.1 2-dehydro-3-deoxyglucarate aldolase [Eubacterium aggregans]